MNTNKIKMFIKTNWLLLVIALFSWISMLNSIEANSAATAANRNAANASDYSAGAADYAADASKYARRAADSAEEAADAANEASMNAMLGW